VQTKVSSHSKKVIISHELPTVLIGERINPTGKGKLASALTAGDFEYVSREAKAQVASGADILDINVGVPGLDETDLLPRAVETVMKGVDAPLCLDSNNPEALRAALRIYEGKALINSVNAEEESLDKILDLAKEFGAAVIALPMDEKGIPAETDGRLELGYKIMERAGRGGIGPEDIVFDALAMSVGADGKTGRVTLQTISKIRDNFDTNQTLGASNVSFGLPDRGLINGAFLPMVLAAGVNCPMVDAARVRDQVLAVDVVLGLDKYAKRYTAAYRQRHSH